MPAPAKIRYSPPQQTIPVKPQPWLAPPPASDFPDEALVLGAGIAGAAAARALAERGCAVTVMDAFGPAAGASGNPAAVLRPVLARDSDDPLSLFYTAAFDAAVVRINRLREQGNTLAGAFEGVLQCHPRARELRGAASYNYLSHEEVLSRLGPSATSDGVWFTEAGWVCPPHYTAALLNHPGIEQVQGEVARLQHNGLSWQLLAANETPLGRANNLVLANGWRLQQLSPTESLPINPVASQLLHFCTAHASDGPPVPVVGGGTLCPTANGWLITAGHWHDSTEDTVDPSRDAEILERSAALWSMPAGADGYHARAAVRATSRDYLPMVGGVPDFAQAATVYEDLHHGRATHHYPPTPYLPGLYVLGALGGRGITSAQLCAEVLCAAFHGEPHPWQMALHPLRFLIRDLKRGKSTV